MKVNWLVDELLTERAYETGYPSIAQVAKEMGHGVYLTKYIPFSSNPDENIPFKSNECVITHGTIQFCKQIEKAYGKIWVPGLYFNDNVKTFTAFASHIGEDLLNSDFIILSLSEFKRRKMKNVFIKPLSGLKEFVGQIASWHDQLSSVEIDPTTLCVISQPQEIKAEFRYVIVNREVITGSEYRWDNVLDVRRDTLPVCDELANKVAKMQWQADLVYVCDIASTDNGPKVIELNAFSSSGLYACDTYKIVEAVSKIAWAEYLGEINQGE